MRDSKVHCKVNESFYLWFFLIFLLLYLCYRHLEIFYNQEHMKTYLKGRWCVSFLICFISFLSFFLSLFFFFFYFTIFYRFCHTSTQIRHRCTHVPNPEPPSHLPPHTISLGHSSATAPSILYPVSNLDWHRNKFMF